MDERAERSTAYLVATSHIDVQWRWTIQDTILCYVPATIAENCDRIEAHLDKPDGQGYAFSFEGAFRYMLAREYFPELYERVRRIIARTGRWCVTGGALVAGDVVVPSPESLIRQFLYANSFFRREFGEKSADVFLPDCFGFPHSLPSIAAHCGRVGFSTQKLTWDGNADNFVPFDLGVWRGVDGRAVLAALRPGAYVHQVPAGDDGSLQAYSGPWPYEGGVWEEPLACKIAASGIGTAYCYFGVGDQGGSPDDDSVDVVVRSEREPTSFAVENVGADRPFRVLQQRLVAPGSPSLPEHDGELLMWKHGTGCYTSATAMKRWNRMNEQLGDAAERAAVAADWLGGAAYPEGALRDAWLRFLVHQFHDDLTGTSIPDAYLFSWNDEVLALNRFASVLSSSIGAVARALDTRAEGVPVIVYNPLSIARKDVVEAELRLPATPPEHVRVFDPSGNEVLSQYRVDSADGETKAVLLFVATVPAAGYTVYDVRPSDRPCPLPSAVSISEDGRCVQSRRYRVTIDESGDVSGIADLASSRDLIADKESLRLQLFADKSRNWPAWEIEPADIAPNGEPRFVDGKPTIDVVEGGPVRAVVRVTRQGGDSVYEQSIRLYADGMAADAVEVATRVDWQEEDTLLKASFPLSISNPQATYDLGWGTIERPNSTYNGVKPRGPADKYEVPGHQWIDLAEPGGAYGVAILSDCKYGWDKPKDNQLRLTLIHTPPAYECGGGSYDRRDVGPNRFRYAVCGHAGGWASGRIPWLAAAFNQPLRAFQTAPHSGPLGRCIPFVEVDTDQVAVMALKKREPEADRRDRHDDVVVRLRELTGSACVAPVRIRIGSGIESAREVNGEEDDLGPVDVVDGAVVAGFSAFQVRTFAVRLCPPQRRLSPPSSASAILPFDTAVVGEDGRFDDTGRAFPDDLFPSTVTCGGVRFELGPRRGENAVRCAGQAVKLDANGRTANRLYLLAAASGDDDVENAVFRLSDRSEERTVPSITARVGRGYDDGQRVRDDAPSYSTPADPYVKHAPVAWYAAHLRLENAADKRRCEHGGYPYPPESGSRGYDCRPYSRGLNDVLPYEFGYMFLLRFDLAGDGPWVLTLPEDRRVLVFAASLADNENDDTTTAGPLFD